MGADAHNCRGIELGQQGKLDEAVLSFREALSSGSKARRRAP